MKLSRCLLGVSAALLAVLGAVRPSLATISMIAQNGYVGADASCWSAWYGTLTNNCSTVKELDMPVATGATLGYASVYVYGGNGSANTVGCQYLSVCSDFSCAYSSSIS